MLVYDSNMPVLKGAKNNIRTVLNVLLYWCNAALLALYALLSTYGITAVKLPICTIHPFASIKSGANA